MKSKRDQETKRPKKTTLPLTMAPVRKSPAVSATEHEVGFRLRGLDGNMYEVMATKDGTHRWHKAKEAPEVTTAAAEAQPEEKRLPVVLVPALCRTKGGYDDMEDEVIFTRLQAYAKKNNAHAGDLVVPEEAERCEQTFYVDKDGALCKVWTNDEAHGFLPPLVMEMGIANGFTLEELAEVYNPWVHCLILPLTEQDGMRLEGDRITALRVMEDNANILVDGDERLADLPDYYTVFRVERKPRIVHTKKAYARCAPAEPAKEHELGFHKEGLDGNTYEVRADKNGTLRWIRVKT